MRALGAAGGGSAPALQLTHGRLPFEGRFQSPFLELRPSAIHGMGVHSCHAIARGTPIARIEGNYIRNVQLTDDVPDAWPDLIGLAPNLWIDPLPPFDHLNHSCAPNAALGARRLLYALADIPVGAEITLDYSTTEADPRWRMMCHCQAPDCRRVLRPIQESFAEPPRATPAMRQAWRRLRLGSGMS